MQPSGHPHREAWHEMGRRFKHHLRIDDDPPQGGSGPAPPGTCRVQVVRSVCDWSHGVLKENSIQNACPSPLSMVQIGVLTIGIFLDRQLIQEANHFIYIGTLRIRDYPEKRLTVIS